MRATFKLLNSYFFKTIYGPILSFIFPPLLLVILGNIMKIQYVYPGIIALSILIIGVMSLPLAIMELKQSSLFKYIGSSPSTPLRFSIVIILYYIFISILAGFVILITTMIFFHASVFPNNGIKYGILGWMTSATGLMSFYVACGIHILFVLACGIAIATFSKTPQQAQSIAIAIILPSMFLSGMILSVDIIASNDAMQWISRLIPFRYTTGNIVVATAPYDQLGDLFGSLSLTDKQLIFQINNTLTHPFTSSDFVIDTVGNATSSFTVNTMDSNGNIIFIGKDVDPQGNISMKPFLISSTNDILVNQDYFNIDITLKQKNLVKEHVLFNLLFVGNPAALVSSDNNIFHWTNGWAVRRIPDVDAIRHFVTEYFKGDTEDASRFADIWTKISSNKPDSYAFLDMFFKQSNILYEQSERILNVLLPLALTAVLLSYAKHSFKWTAR